MNREQANTERTAACKNGQRIGYFDHNLRTLVLDGDNFTNRETWKDWRAFKKEHSNKGVSEFLFRCIAELKADGNRKGSIKVPWERLRAKLKLGMSNSWTPYVARDMAYQSHAGTLQHRQLEKHSGRGSQARRMEPHEANRLTHLLRYLLRVKEEPTLCGWLFV